MTKGEKILKDIKKDATVKQPKTIQVATLMIIIISLAVGFFGGTQYQGYIQWHIENEAKAIVKSLE